MEKKIDVQRAAPEDYSALTELAEQLGHKDESGKVRARLLDLLTRDDQVVLVAVVDGEIVGWVHAYLSRPLHKETVVDIVGLVVEKSYRKLGIGRRLLEVIEEWAIKQGCSEVCLCSNIVREEAHKFYQTIGYELIKTQYTFRKILKQ